MTRSLFLAPLPQDRAHPGVGFAVIAAHIGLLFIANLYWPLQTVAERIVVQVFRSDTATSRVSSPDGLTPGAAPSLPGEFTRNPGSITARRFGRAATQLDLPSPDEAVVPNVPAPPAAQQSTPLSATPQTAREKAAPVPARAAPPASPAAPVPAVEPKPVPEPERVAAPAAAASAPPLAPAVQPAQQAVVTPPVATVTLPTPGPAPLPSPAVATPQPSVAASTLTAPVAPTAVSRSTVTLAAPVPAPATASAPGLASPPSGSASPSPSGTGPAAATAGPGGTGTAPGGGPQGQGLSPQLDLRLPPRYIYRPPVSLPQRSLSEMANEQLRRKPRDPFAEAVEGAANIDCQRETPEGPAQGLLAIGPLLKRAIEEKCKR
ncbi:MAG: hypothetical protein V4625_19980 [Pseudomonadota bacterium]